VTRFDRISSRVRSAAATRPTVVVASCLTHHRVYDQAALDLVAFLEPDWRREAAHAVLHLGLAGALRRLGGRRAAGEEG
jgi:hypothetical protein